MDSIEEMSEIPAAAGTETGLHDVRMLRVDGTGVAENRGHDPYDNPGTHSIYRDSPGSDASPTRRLRRARQ